MRIGVSVSLLVQSALMPNDLLTRRRWQRKHSDDEVRPPHFPMAEAVGDDKLKIPIGSKLQLGQACASSSRREKVLSGRSCSWLDILLRIKTTKGKSEMKQAARGINPASKPSGDGCVECLALPKGWWFHLRRCAECGHIGCCDSSPNQHASKHATATGHPIIASFEPGDDWFFDYEKRAMVKGAELLPPHSHPRSQPALPWTGRKGTGQLGIAPELASDNKLAID